MIGTDFIYNNQSLSDFNMYMAAPEDTDEWSRRDLVRSDITAVRKAPVHYTVKYTDTLVLHFFIIKCDNTTEGGDALTPEEIHELRSWLESPKVPTLLQTLDDNDYDNINYFGVFTDVQPYTFGDYCYGLKLTFTCNAPYGFSDIIENVYTISGTNTTGKYLSNSADKNDYIYPIIKISASGSTFGSSSNITLKNESDNNNKMELTCPSAASSLTIDCQKKLIYDNNNNYICLSDIVSANATGVLSAPNYSFYWLRLLPSINNLKFTVNNSSIASVTIQARDAIKAGGF